MFSSKEAAQHFELGYAIFYGAAYDFYEGDASSIYKDSKNKKFRYMPVLNFLIKVMLTRILRKEFYCYIIIRSVIKKNGFRINMVNEEVSKNDRDKYPGFSQYPDRSS